ncbi:MAG: hypothetical protein ACJ8AW_04385 [Rhodopila sp.]
MPFEPPVISRFTDLWSMLHEGGVLVETRVGGPETPVALRTLLQIDGDRVVRVGWNALKPLSHNERLRLAVQHRQAVRAGSVTVLSGLERWLTWGHTLPLGLFFGNAAHRLWIDRAVL